MLRTSNLLIILLALALIAGCTTPSTGEESTATPLPPSAIATAPPTPVIATATATVAATVDPVALCPAASAGTTQYISLENGVCFLYPSDLAVEGDMFRPDEMVHLVGERVPQGGMDSVAVDLSIAYNGPADGLDSTQYAQMWVDLNLQGLNPQQENSEINGQTAVILNELPGMVGRQAVFLVANGVKYQIILLPRPEEVPQLTEEATLAWETVTQSIIFFPAQNTRTVVRPADVCPAETADSKLVLDLIGGYCLLSPADFAPNPDFPGTIVGGPELGPYGDFPSVRASLAVGTYELESQSLDQGLQPLSEQIDPASVMNTTISGYPAVVYDFTGGPWRQRNAQIVVGSNVVYTFVAQPWDEEKFPQALADVERVWTLATESVAFFDKWR
ncbi:MAG: hypothetical protein KDE31_36520 [Caldilineaceae bacterium]|nr:hypothetical protein [Caldilineaceae bacterium]